MLKDNDNWDDNVVQCSCCVDDEGVGNRTHGADDDGGNDGDDEGEEDVQDCDYEGSRNVILTPSTRHLYH